MLFFYGSQGRQCTRRSSSLFSKKAFITIGNSIKPVPQVDIGAHLSEQEVITYVFSNNEVIKNPAVLSSSSQCHHVNITYLRAHFAIAEN